MRQRDKAFAGQLSSVFFGSRRAALISSLFSIAVAALMYIAYLQVSEEAHIDLPTGQADKTATVPTKLVPPREILVLNSYHVGLAWSDNEMTGIIEILQETSPDIHYSIEYLDCKRHPKYEHFERVRDLFQLKYGSRDIPVVMVADNPALEFALKYRSRLFPHAAIVFCGVNSFKKEMLAGQTNITGLAEALNAVDTVRLALRLHPGTKTVVIVHDYTATGLATRREAEQQLQGRFGGVSFRYLEDMTKDELTRQLKELPKDSLVLALAYNVFKDGEVIAHETLARLLSSKAPVPVYGVHRERIGYGIVGGSLLSGKLHGREAGRVALRILSGTQAAQIPVDMTPPTRIMFDHIQLVRFGIPVNALPAGSIVVNRPIPFISSHLYLVVSTLLVIGILASGICILGINIYRRELVEADLRTAKEELETRVSERTDELQQANVLLHVELAERRKAEELLRQREAELNESQRLAHIGSWDWDAVNDRIWWSDEYYRIYGFDPHLPTPSYADHLKAYTPESAERLDSSVKQTMENGAPYEVDLELAQPTPGTQWIVARGEAKRDASGNIRGLRGTAQNITERKRAEEELHRINEELELRVGERTKELVRRNHELEQMNKSFVGRELRMVELKERIRALEMQAVSKNR